MISRIEVICGFFIALLCSYFATPIFRNLAIKLGLTDRPSEKKVHARPVALLGGIAIFASFSLAIIIYGGVNRITISMLTGGWLLVLWGIYDDKYGMSPKIKLLGQFISALIVINSGALFMLTGSPFIDTFVTVFWIMAIINTMNLLDNLNGLSAGVASIAAFFFGIISWQQQQPIVAIIAFSLMGSCLGFLRYNFPKASIFMGDAGSMPLGFVLAYIALLGSWKTASGIVSIAVPIFILGYPIFDTSLVAVTRILHKRHIYSGGKDHSSHRLASMGLKRKGAVLFIFVISFLLGIIAISITRLSLKDALLILLITLTCIIAMGIRLAMLRVYYNKSIQKERAILKKAHSTPSHTKAIASNILSKVTEWSIYGLLLVIPFSKASIEVFAAIAIISFIVSRIINRNYTIRKNPLNLSIFLFFIFTLLSFINSNYMLNSLRGAFTKLGEAVLIYFILSEHACNSRVLKNILKAIIFSAFIISVDGIFQYFFNIDYLRWHKLFGGVRVTASFGDPNDFAAWIIIIFPLMLILSLLKVHDAFKSRISVSFIRLTTILLLVSFFLTLSKGAWLSLTISLFLIFLFIRKRAAIIGLILIFVIFVYLFAFTSIQPLQYQGGFFDRLNHWQIAFQIFKRFPIFGAGANTYIENDAIYMKNDIKSASYVHNCYLQIMAETGFLGLMAFILIIASLFRITYAALRQVNRQNRILLLGLFGGVLATFFHSFVDTNLYSLQISLFFWAFLGIYIGYLDYVQKKEGCENVFK